LLPFSFTHPVCELRIGIFTIRKKWESLLEESINPLSVPYLQDKFTARYSGDNLLINASVLPDEQLKKEVISLSPNEKLEKEGELVALRCDNAFFEELNKNYDPSGIEQKASGFKRKGTEVELSFLNNIWEIFQKNGYEIQKDLKLLDIQGRTEYKENKVLGDSLYVDDEVEVNHSTINTETGPVYIEKGAEVMEGSVIRGPFALLEGGVVKMSAKIYGPTTVGPYSKVGGELNNCVIQGYSNKAHDGFLGNSVIGKWCNIGADTNNSNLKNNYSEVKIWDYETESQKNTGTKYCGLFMGDHSKCGINTMFNTGTVIGVSANIFGGGFPQKFIPSFSWGGSHGFETFDIDKAFETAERMCARRDVDFDEQDRSILRHVYKESEKWRMEE
ncbi:MAG: GlmU family protein, partial [Flavobacteriales bacterium]